MSFEPRSYDESMKRNGYKKCVCGHWDFTHDSKLTWYLGFKDTWCHDCKCEQFKENDD
jgi:hypothetical protein